MKGQTQRLGVYIYMYIHIHIHTEIHAYMHVHIYTHIDRHTGIHIHTQPFFVHGEASEVNSECTCFQQLWDPESEHGSANCSNDFA